MNTTAARPATLTKSGTHQFAPGSRIFLGVVLVATAPVWAPVVAGMALVNWLRK